MLHFSFDRKLTLVMAALLAASAVSVVALTPAASGEIRPLLQSLGNISCSSPNPCQEGSNAGMGAGLEGISAKGKGVIGQTSFASTSSSNGQAGVLGIDHSTSGVFDVGVKGTSTKGFGVSGVSNSSSFPGAGVSGLLGPPSGLLVFAAGAVYGDSRDGSGVLATSANASAVVAASGNSFGVDGLTFNKSLTTGRSLSGVLGNDASSDGGHLNAGVSGVSKNGIGVVAFSNNFVGANVVGGNISLGVPALSIVDNSSVADFIDACLQGTAFPCNSSKAIFRVNNNASLSAQGFASFGGSIEGACLNIQTGGCFSGDVNISGQYQKSGSCVAGCAVATAAHPGRAVVSYVPTQSLPTVDDFGEATLQNGYAYVRLDPAFANVIDQSANYLVFLTPEGDSRGLYVMQKTVRGFAVHENMGGHSSLAFSYRIVAKPLGSREARLPMVELPKLRSSLPIQARRFHPKPRPYVSPTQFGAVESNRPLLILGRFARHPRR